MPVEIIYETHSWTEDMDLGRATGWLPGALTARGRQLAAELGARRARSGIAAVFTSDLRRAVETASIAFDGAAIPIYQDARLRECNYGELNGSPVSVIAAQRLARIDHPFPGGQSYRDVCEATRAFLVDLANGWNGPRVLVIAHSANKWALDHLLLGCALEDLVDAPFGWQEGWTYLLDSSSLADQ